MDRLLEELSLEVPQGHIDGRHRGDRDRRATEVHRAAVHLLPQAFGLERVLTNQQLSKAASDIVAERSINDRLDDFGLRIGFSDPFQPCVSTDSNEHGVLTARGFRFNTRNPQKLTNNLRNLHEIQSSQRVPCTMKSRETTDVTNRGQITSKA